MKKLFVLSVLFVNLAFSLCAQTSDAGTLKGGIRLQKAQKLYWENGFAFDYANSKWLDGRIHLGASYATSRLGSALGSNALKQDNFLLSTAYHFRPRQALQPFVRLNLGYFQADYESPLFDALPNSTFVTALDAGLSYRFHCPLTLECSAGYNLSAGTGTSGPGTLFPVYYQLSILYTLF